MCYPSCCTDTDHTHTDPVVHNPDPAGPQDEEETRLLIEEEQDTIFYMIGNTVCLASPDYPLAPC